MISFLFVFMFFGFSFSFFLSFFFFFCIYSFLVGVFAQFSSCKPLLSSKNIAISLFIRGYSQEVSFTCNFMISLLKTDEEINS